MREKKVILQPSERILIEELWKNNPQTITQLFHTLNVQNGWTKSTVNTMLKRMSEKGIIRYEQGKKAKQYYPAVERDFVNSIETENFLSRVYKGSVSLMMNTLLKENKLKESEIQELYDMLKEIEEQ